MNIREAAEATGKNPRTIRRWIESGKIDATHRQGKFGPECEITNIPRHLIKQPIDNTQKHVQKPHDKAKTKTNPHDNAKGSTKKKDNRETEIQRLWKEIHRLQKLNNELVATLGAAQERIQTLEPKQIEGPRASLWRRLLRR